MNTKEIIGLLCTVVALLAAAVVTHVYQLWSYLGNYTVPWFCDSTAIALLLVTLTSVLTGCPPSIIPIGSALAVVVGSSLAVGLGMYVDSMSYNVLRDSPSSIGEWVGFTLIVLFVFWIPRNRRKESAEPTSAGDSSTPAASLGTPEK